MPKTAARWLTICAALFCLALCLGRGAAAGEEAYDWRSVPFGGAGFVDGFVYHPKQKDILYARTDIGGMYRYDFAAKRWLPLFGHIGHADGDLMGVLSIALDPNDPGKVYAACGLYLPDWGRKGAILRSDDQGRTWAKTELPIHVGGNSDGRGSGDRLAVDPQNGNVLFYGSNQDGLWKSTNGGKTFNREGTPARSITLVLIDPRTGEIVIGSADGKGGLLVSHNGGDSFKSIAGTPDQIPQHAVYTPDGSLVVTFAEGDGSEWGVNPSRAVGGSVWKRDPAGRWSDITPVRPDAKIAFGYSGVDAGPGGTLAVSTLDRWSVHDDIFVSKDGGANWKALGAISKHDAKAYPWLLDYLNGEDRMGHWIADLKINPFNADEMIYGTGFGLYVSRNLSAAQNGGPVTFDFAVAGLEEAATLQMVSPTGGAAPLAAFGDVGGAAWFDTAKSPQANGIFHPTTETNYSIDYAGLRPSFLVRSTNNDPTHGLYSEDGGASWKPMPATPYQAPAAGKEWRGPGIIAVSARGTSMVWAPEKDTAYFSTDLGKSWRKSAGWPGGDQKPVPVADKAVDGVYYVFDRVGGRILISVDAGASFNSIAGGMPKIQSWESSQLAVVPGRMRDLWLATPISLIHSKDSSTPVVDMKDVDTVWAVSFGAPRIPGAYPAVYISGKVKGREGLWRSDDEGASWVRINDDTHQFGGFQPIAGDMREFGTLYVAPHGMGVMVGKPHK
jgi:hypothetical protein